METSHSMISFSRLLSITNSGGFNTAFSYYGPEPDRALNTITSTLPGGGTIGKHTYGYDDQGRITSWQRVNGVLAQ